MAARCMPVSRVWVHISCNNSNNTQLRGCPSNHAVDHVPRCAGRASFTGNGLLQFSANVDSLTCWMAGEVAVL